MKSIFTIGRDPQCDITVFDPTNVVSRVHASLRVDGRKYFITDQSQNGTYINGMKITSNVEVPVSRKDSISFAHACDFDWNSIPKSQSGNGWAIVGYVAAAAAALSLIVLATMTIARSMSDKTPAPADPDIKIAAPQPTETAPTSKKNDGEPITSIEIKPVQDPAPAAKDNSSAKKSKPAEKPAVKKNELPL